MSKKLSRIIPCLLAVAILAFSASALGLYKSGETITGSVSQSHNWVSVWYTSNGNTQIGGIEPRFSKGGLFAPDSVYTSYNRSGSYTAKADFTISHSNGVTHSKTMSYTTSNSDSLNGTLWEPASAFSIVLTESITSGKVTFKNS
jgi:hypothetical protein